MARNLFDEFGIDPATLEQPAAEKRDLFSEFDIDPKSLVDEAPIRAEMRRINPSATEDEINYLTSDKVAAEAKPRQTTEENIQDRVANRKKAGASQMGAEQATVFDLNLEQELTRRQNGIPAQVRGDAGALQREDWQKQQVQAAKDRKPPEDNRGLLGRAGDIGLGVMQGGQGVIKIFGDIYGLTTGDMDNSVSEFGKKSSDFFQGKMSKYQQFMTKADAARLEQIGKDSGLGAQFVAGLYQSVTDPVAFARNAPLMLAGGLGGTATKAAVSTFLKTATEGTLVGIGTAGGVATGAAMQGADVGGDAYERLMNLPQEKWDANKEYRAALMEYSDKAAAKHAVALGLAREAALKAGAISIAANMLPMGDSLERVMAGGKLSGGMAARVAGAGLGEMGSEGLEEGGGKKFANEAVAYIDPTQRSMEGVGVAAGLGAGTGGLMGGAAGAMGGTRPQAAPTPAPRAPTVADIMAPEASVDDAITAAQEMVRAPTETDTNDMVQQAMDNIAQLTDGDVFTTDAGDFTFQAGLDGEMPSLVGTDGMRLPDELAAPMLYDTAAVQAALARRAPPVTQPEGVLDGRTDVGGTNAEMAAQGVESAGSDVLGSGADTQAGMLGGLAGGSGSAGSMATPAGVDSVAGDAGVPGVEPVLPKELAGSKPRYGYKDKQFTLTFESDIDKAAYITAQKTPSKRDAEFVAFAVAQSGLTEAQVRDLGLKVRDRIKGIAKNADPGELTINRVYQPAGEPIAPKPTQSITQEGQTQSPQVTSEGATPAVVVTPAQQKVVDAVNASLVDEQAKLGDKAPPLQVLTVAAPEQVTPAVQEALPLAQAFLQAAGYQHEVVVVAPTDDKTLDFDGAVASNGAGIVIAADSARTVPRVVVHEFGHEMRKEAPQVWETLAAEILGRTDKAAQMAHLKKRGYAGETLTPPMAEEFVNDVLSDMLNSGKEGPRILVDVASNMDKAEPGSGKEFLKRLLEFIDKVIKGMVGKGYGTEATILKGEVGAIRKAIAKALTDYNLQAKKAEKAAKAAAAAEAEVRAAEAKKAALAAEVERAKAKPAPEEGTPSSADLSSGRAFVRNVNQKIDRWVSDATKNGSRPMDRNWERAAVKRFVEAEVSRMLSGKQYGNRAASKIAVAKSTSFEELRAALEKFVDVEQAKPAEPTPPVDTATDEVAKADEAGVDVFAGAPQAFLSRINKGVTNGVPILVMKGSHVNGAEYTLYEPGHRSHLSADWKTLQGEDSGSDAVKVAMRYREKEGIVYATPAAEDQMAEQAQSMADEKAKLDEERKAREDKANADAVARQRLADALDGAKFTKGEFTPASDKGAKLEPVAGVMHGGLIVHKSPGHFLRGQQYTVSHVATGMAVLHGFKSQPSAKQAAVRLSRLADMTMLTKKEDIQTKPFETFTEVAKAIKKNDGDPLAEPQIDAPTDDKPTGTDGPKRKKSEVKRSLRNVITRDTRDALVKGWTQIGGADTAFTYPRSESKSLGEIMLKVAPRLQVDHLGGDVDLADGWMVFAKDADGKADRTRPGYVMQYKDGKVELNVAEWGEGNDGAALYAAVGNYAYNNGLVFAGDRMGISETGRARRLENMISLALKYKTTRHIEPHVDMLVDFSWEEGNDNYNLGEMLAASYRLTAEIAPEIEDITYDPDTKEFTWVPAADRRAGRSAGDGQDAAEGYNADTDAGGTTVSESDFKKIVEDARDRGGRLGRKTLVRAILSNTFARRAQANEGVGERAGDVVVPGDVTDGVLYSKRDKASDAELARKLAHALAGYEQRLQPAFEQALNENQAKSDELKRFIVPHEESEKVGEALARETGISTEQITEMLQGGPIEVNGEMMHPVEVISTAMSMVRINMAQLVDAESSDDMAQKMTDTMNMMLALRANISEVARALSFVGYAERKGGAQGFEIAAQAEGKPGVQAADKAAQDAEKAATDAMDDANKALDELEKKDGGAFRETEAADNADKVSDDKEAEATDVDKAATDKKQEAQKKREAEKLAKEKAKNTTGKAQVDAEAEAALSGQEASEAELKALAFEAHAKNLRREAGKMRSEAKAARKRAEAALIKGRLLKQDAEVWAADAKRKMDRARKLRAEAIAQKKEAMRVRAQAQRLIAKSHSAIVKAKMQADTANRAIKKMRYSLTKERILEALGGEAEMQKIFDELKRQGHDVNMHGVIMMFQGMAGQQLKAMKIAEAQNAGPVSKTFATMNNIGGMAAELFKAYILSRFSTHTLNVVSTWVHRALEMRITGTLAEMMPGGAGAKKHWQVMRALTGVSASALTASKFAMHAESRSAQMIALLKMNVRDQKMVIDLTNNKWMDNQDRYLPGTFGKYVRNMGFTPLGMEDAYLKTFPYLYSLALQEAEGRVPDYQEAVEYAETIAFQSHLSPIGRAVNGMIKKVPVLGTHIPFITTLDNLIMKALQYTPGVGVAFVGLDQKGLEKANKTGDPMKIRRAIDLRNKSLARSIVGGMIGALTILAYGNDDDDEDKGLMGLRPTDPNEFAIWRQENGVLAVGFAGRNISFERFDPLSSSVGLTIAAINAVRAANDDKDDTSARKELMKGTYQMLISKTFIEPFTEMLLSFKDENRADKSAVNYYANLLSAMTIPGALAQFAEVPDDLSRETKPLKSSRSPFFDAYLNKTAAKIPGLRDNLDPTLDVWGEAADNPGYLNPLPVRPVKSRPDPLNNWLLKMGKSIHAKPASLEGMPFEKKQELLRKRHDMLTRLMSTTSGMSRGEKKEEVSRTIGEWTRSQVTPARKFYDLGKEVDPNDAVVD